MWQKIVGHYILEPYQLNELSRGQAIHYVGDTPTWTSNNIAGMSKDKFLLRAEDSIPSVFSASILLDIDNDPLKVAPFEVTGKYTGIPSLQNIDDITVGGGLISTYGYNSTAPVSLLNSSANVYVTKKFSLSDIIGISSSFLCPLLLINLRH